MSETKNDRELLEAAARAAGIDSKDWNPLDDDGEALRLAVRRRLVIEPEGSPETVSVWSYDDRVPVVSEPHGADVGAAIRRAIVRAAASEPTSELSPSPELPELPEPFEGGYSAEEVEAYAVNHGSLRARLERERCAKIAEDMGHSDVANAIR